jgi:O-antigen/teichoic acid export membrane protein
MLKLTIAMIILYLGPGIGGGVLALIIGFLVSLLTFIVAIFWYPIKKLLNFFKTKKK